MTAAQTAQGLADRDTQPRAAETSPGQLPARGRFTKTLRRKPPHPGRVRARLCELRARNARMQPCRSAHGRAPASSGEPSSRSSPGQSGGFLNRRQEVRVLPGAPFSISTHSDAPPGCAVRSFCQPRGQEVQQSRSPLFVFHGGRYGESPSFRSWPRRAAPVPPSDDGRQPARSIGLAIGFRGTRDRGFGLQDTCPHAGTIPASRPGPLNAACAKKRRVSHGRSDDDSGPVQPLQSRPTRGGRSQ